MAFPRRLAALLAALAAATVAAPARAQHPGVTFGPPPDWVVKSELGESRPYDETLQTDGAEHLLLDDQIRTGAGPRECYTRHVYRILDEKGIRDAAQIEIEFAPAYETVVIHGLAVYRGDEEVSRVAAAGLRVLDREQNLEGHVYQERLSILAILDDVRIGDRIESCYTIRGENPVFDGRFATRFSLGWGVPLRRSSLRVLLPADRTLHVRAQRASAEPIVNEAGGWREYRWDRNEVPAVLPENRLPSWFDPYPRLELSEFADWAEVRRWGMRLYEPPPTRSPELAAKIDEIAGLHEQPEARILAALAFVRDEIRYLSLALGPHSHRPSPADTVLQRRFGDCKDKTVLLVALLQGLGVRARPAYVSTQTLAHAAECLPSPLAFDHVIVRVEHEGKTFWLDPTNLHARGSLGRLSCPRFGVALVLDESATDLQPIEPAFDDQPGFHVETDIDASGSGREARIRVESTYTWESADSMRARLGETGRASLEKSYLDYYAHSYPAIRSDGSLEIQDDEVENVIVVTERYLVPDFWKPTEDGARLEASIHATEISDLVSIPSTAVRTMPLGISHPINVRCHISARLPRAWGLDTVRRRVDTDAVHFACDIHTSGKEADLDYVYTSLQDALPPEKALAHVEQLDRILEVTRYELSYPASAEAEPEPEPEPESTEDTEREGRHWLMVFLFAVMSFAVTAAISLALFLYRPKGPPPAVEPADAHLQGIRGWLALAGIGIVLTPLTALVGTVKTLGAFDSSTWAILTTPGSTKYHELWAPTLLAELFCHIGLFNLSCVLVALFLMKRRSFPALFIATRVGWTLFLILDSAAAASLSIANASISPRDGGTLCGSLIWVLYFLKSRRVKATFVR